ncbi:MAG: S-adenosyl-l-methionine hydroxide adenosyltransferase family protein [Flavobacteriales bacterium Tduv]
MSIITLSTDWGRKGPSVARIKGDIYSELKEAQVVDITHDISPFDIEEAVYIIKSSYNAFPKGSIHLIGVDTEIRLHRRHIAMSVDGHYFICSDNGILALICSEYRPEKVVELEVYQDESSVSSSTKKIFSRAACHLLRWGKLEIIGRSIDRFKSPTELKPQVKENNSLIGTVIYIDHFGNVVINITKKLFDEVGKKRPFEVQARNYVFREIYRHYSEAVKDPTREDHYHGDALVRFNPSGYLEIAVYKSNPRTVGGAETLLGLRRGASVHVKFLQL